MSSTTRTDAVTELTDILATGGAGLPADYDLESVVDECHQVTGSFNLNDVPEQEFWEILSVHQHSGRVLSIV